MSKKQVIVIETDGKYEVENSEMSKFELIGVLECVLFDLKTAGQEKPTGELQTLAPESEQIFQNSKKIEPENKSEKPEETEPEAKKESVQKSSDAPDLRTRIRNATKAIRSLGGKIEDTDLTRLTDEELKAELDELTSQYKRLKGSPTASK